MYKIKKSWEKLRFCYAPFDMMPYYVRVHAYKTTKVSGKNVKEH